MRKKIVAGNWKMNNTLDEGLKLTSEIVNMVSDEVRGDVHIVLAPPFIHLTQVKKLISGVDKVYLGAQNCNDNAQGAYTGEVSAAMLASVGAEYVIIGHSERREYFNENHKQLAQKVDLALENNLTPIFCCGESLEVRENGLYKEYVCNQIGDSLFHLHDDKFSKIVIAYEPIWAIGTGKTASSDQAQEMHATIREFIAERYGGEISENMSILYGGSCKPDNAKELFACKDVDGGLIGGASLKSRDFTDIIKSF
ncbi:triose-phosphate isomerase [Fulvivirga kasyanovii]|uniref:Triosephosphate isomerase n=1 Tax=Fulvivirga kasyanovii TaxID=396812 RepID=A0ABW9RTI8_9BACT|nr:triose-phosphate isomerase [Fulvivirga kasyanovii]MTI27504.1 triose-phosphate isomerase [Fulvivirga kasyanovii]